LYGINHSTVILLLISEKSLERIMNADKYQDNVLLEFQYAMHLKEQGKADVYTLLVASNEQTADGKPCYVKLRNLGSEESLARFPDALHLARDEAGRENVRATMRNVFALQHMHIEADALVDKIPKIETYWRRAAKRIAAPGMIEQLKTPTPSLRLIGCGVGMGIFGFLLSLSLLFMPTNSRRHQELKYGITIGHIIAFIGAMIIAGIYAAVFLEESHGLQCTNCEYYVLNGPEEIPYYDFYLSQCKGGGACPSGSTDQQNTTLGTFQNTTLNSNECLACMCANNVYVDCQFWSAVGVTMVVTITLLFAAMVAVYLISKTINSESSIPEV